MDRGDLALADEELARCLALHEPSAAAHALRGGLFATWRLGPGAEGLPDEKQDELVARALAHLDRALELEPENVKALLARFKVRSAPRLRRYDPEAALADGERLVALQPDNPMVLFLYTTWLFGEVRFPRGRGDRSSFDSSIGLEIAEVHIERLQDQLPVGTPLYCQNLGRLATLYLYMGDFERAASTYEQLLGFPIPVEMQALTQMDLGFALYRQGRPEEAAKYFLLSFENTDRLEPLWLLRLSYEAMGRSLTSLPERYVFPRADERFDGERPPRLRFTDVGAGLGVAKLDGAGPSAFADVDGDGDDDLIVAGCDTYTALYRNEGARFVDATLDAGLAELESGFSTNLVDYDDDGDLDLYVARNGWSGDAPNIFLRNRGDGTFEDVSRASGLDDPGCGFVSQWADFDGDGRLDVFLANGVIGDGCTARLYRNRGDGTFEDVTGRAGLQEPRRWGTIGVAVGDIDGDGDADIFCNGRAGAPNRLYRNRGDGTFEERARAAGVEGVRHNGYVALFLDYDNDADLDILETSLAEWEDVLRGLAGTLSPPSRRSLPENTPRLYRNDGAGSFTDVTFDAGLVYPHGVMGANVADLDNDGYLDLYLGTGDPQPQRLEPSVLYRNQGDGTFTDLTRLSGLGHLGKGHGFTFADFDADGDLDIYAPQGGFYHGDLWANPLYRNEAGSENHWLHLRVKGVASNRFAVGARITLHAGGLRQVREVQGGTGFGSTDSYTVEFGLGDRTEVEAIEIRWPAGLRQRLSAPPVDALLEITEGEDGWKVVHRGRAGPPGHTDGETDGGR